MFFEGSHVVVNPGSFGAREMPSTVVTAAIHTTVMDCFTISNFVQAVARPVTLGAVTAAWTGPARLGSMVPPATLTAQGRFLLVFLNVERKSQGVTQHSGRNWAFPVAHDLLTIFVPCIPCSTSEFWEFMGNYLQVKTV